MHRWHCNPNIMYYRLKIRWIGVSITVSSSFTCGGSWLWWWVGGSSYMYWIIYYSYLCFFLNFVQGWLNEEGDIVIICASMFIGLLCCCPILVCRAPSGFCPGALACLAYPPSYKYFPKFTNPYTDAEPHSQTWRPPFVKMSTGYLRQSSLFP